MQETIYTHRALKLRAKATIRQFATPCLLASIAVLAFSFASLLIRNATGGLISPGFLDPAKFPVDSGLWSVSPALMEELGLGAYAAQGGLMAAVRVESAGAVLVYVLSLIQVLPVLISSGIILLVSAPILFGAAEQLWSVVNGAPAAPARLFRWYLDLRLTGKALLTELAVGLWEWATRLLGILPAMALMVFVAQTDGDSPVWYAVMALMLAGLLGGYWLSLMLAPVRLILARAPELSLPAAFRQGVAVLRGRRKAFFQLALSFLPWHLLSLMTYGLAELFLFPYQRLSYMYFILEAEAQPVPQSADGAVE